ncbi:protein-export chaperone SecB [Ignatzschineria rhizosphaerae]|uniref:Protein-export protein SecB n=1 Tax=Ignatzschineria rhizosphaerae TaxID=2923279 RepID=A0ABY3X2U2_9GAMM|nr:protein-export chaperone SecB [Ignatzschineria rhizosphaerae]UNM95777.1 protein-export chaperone SecB [Ignatzschineria rhizosphaerae]
MSQENQATFDILRIYTKNVSLESPNAPEAFKTATNPEIQIQLSNEERVIEEGIHEVALKVTVTAKLEEKVLFVAEVEQAGLFQLANFPEEQLKAIKGGYCPNILYPYARQALDNLVSGAGFPPVVLSPINFEAVYAERQAQVANEATKDEKKSKKTDA